MVRSRKIGPLVPSALDPQSSPSRSPSLSIALSPALAFALSLALTISSCGSSVGTAGAPASPAASKEAPKETKDPGSNVRMADSKAAISCVPEANNFLFYVKDEQKFYLCDGAALSQAPIAGGSGISIASNRLIAFSNVNLCTDSPATEACYFSGGQRVKFSDGTVFITGGYSFWHLGASYADKMSTAISLFAPKDSPYVWQRLDWDVCRGGICRSIFLLYEREADKLRIIFDKDNDKTPSLVHDDIILLPTMEDW